MIGTQDNKLDAIEKIIPEWIAEALKITAEKHFEEMKADMMAKLELKKAEVISSIVISLLKETQFEQIGNKLVISIQMQES